MTAVKQPGGATAPTQISVLRVITGVALMAAAAILSGGDIPFGWFQHHSAEDLMRLQHGFHVLMTAVFVIGGYLLKTSTSR